MRILIWSHIDASTCISLCNPNQDIDLTQFHPPTSRSDALVYLSLSQNFTSQSGFVLKIVNPPKLGVGKYKH